MRWRVLLQQIQRFSVSANTDKEFCGVLGKIKMPFYAVAKGRSVGVYQTWGECEAQVKGFSGARYKKFDTPDAAQEFIQANGGSAPKTNFYNYKVQNHAGPSNSLKRNYSTTSSYQNSKPRQEATQNGNNTESNKGRKAIMIEPPEAKRRRSNDGFDKDSEGFVQVYTDGACSQNGRSGARAGLGVYWGDGHSLNISRPVSGRATNNCGEIQAATCAIKQALENGVTKLAINTDSQFLINSVTKWLPGWKRKGWKLASGEPVKNETDFKDLDSVQNKLKIKWKYVEAHKGIHGNEMADQLARQGAAAYDKH